jgi:CRP/FNR family transcriptional regulator
MAAATHEMHDGKSVQASAGRQCGGQLWSSIRDLCALLKMEPGSTTSHEDVLFQHIRFKTGERIFRLGEQFEKLYVVRLGFLKNVIIDSSGEEQILSFPMKGDLIGIDGLHSKTYVSEAVALSDGEVVVIPYKTLRTLAIQHAAFESVIYSHMSRELIREQTMIGMLSGLSAEARVARFIVTIGHRFEQIGYSRRSYNLRMTRREIGSYLGVTLETVSRTLSLFADMGYISVDGRTISIYNEDALQMLRRVPASVPRRGRQPRNDLAAA